MTDCDLLLVEDNSTDAELSLRVLRKENLSSRVHLVRDGEEALDFLFCTGTYAGRNMENCPKVVFLDLKIPKVDGIEVLRRLKADARTRSIPVVVLTSSREDSDIDACYALGVNSYIVKPVDFAQFVHAVHQLGLYWLLLNEQ